jgi:hypothetical protein
VFVLWVVRHTGRVGSRASHTDGRTPAHERAPPRAAPIRNKTATTKARWPAVSPPPITIKPHNLGLLLIVFKPLGRDQRERLGHAHLAPQKKGFESPSHGERQTQSNYIPFLLGRRWSRPFCAVEARAHERWRQRGCPRPSHLEVPCAKTRPLPIRNPLQPRPPPWARPPLASVTPPQTPVFIFRYLFAVFTLSSSPPRPSSFFS